MIAIRIGACPSAQFDVNEAAADSSVSQLTSRSDGLPSGGRLPSTEIAGRVKMRMVTCHQQARGVFRVARGAQGTDRQPEQQASEHDVHGSRAARADDKQTAQVARAH